MTSEQAIQQARRVLNLDLIPARLGKGDGTGTVYDLNNQGNYWVRKIEANGNFSQAFSLPVNPLASIPPSDGLAVSIGYDLHGIQCIWQADTISLKAANINPLILNPLDSAVYGKTSQTNISTLFYQRHGNTALFPFTVVVFKAPTIINRQSKMFPGGSVDLSSFVPSSGFKCYASVFLLADMTLGAFASTPINEGDPLRMDVDIQECLTASPTDSAFICAWEIQGGDATLSPDPTRNVDMRQIVNMPQTGTTGTPLTVTDGVTTVTDVIELDFDGATVNDLGGGVAEVVITGGTGSYPPPIDLVNTDYTIATNTQVIVNRFEISGTGSLVINGTGAVYYV